MFDFLNGPYVVLPATYDPINKILKPIIIDKHIFLSGPIFNPGAIMDRP